jgi:(1->4)-alpha-D-glucan 1-alpha-D-glucosylmutase
VAARHFAGLTDGGRIWPRGETFEGSVNLAGYAVDGMKMENGDLPLSALFRHLPVAVLKAKLSAAEKGARKRIAA